MTPSSVLSAKACNKSAAGARGTTNCLNCFAVRSHLLVRYYLARVARVSRGRVLSRSRALLSLHSAPVSAL
jgi:hypothetical protein